MKTWKLGEVHKTRKVARPTCDLNDPLGQGKGRSEQDQGVSQEAMAVIHVRDDAA